MRKLLISIVLLLCLAVPLWAQSTTDDTTLSAAVTTTSGQNIRVTSATGFVAGSTFAFVDHEQMEVLGVSGVSITVRRGSGSTVAATHASGARVLVGPSTAFVSWVLDPIGACTANTYAYMPIVNTRTGNVLNCVSNVWNLGSTLRYIYTIPGAMTTGTIQAISGNIVVPASTAISGSFLQAVYGKVTLGTSDTFTGTALAGIYGKVDVTGATAITAGNNAAVQANIVGVASGTWSGLQGIYVESAGGGVINSYLRGFGKATYVFDFESNVFNNMSTTGAGSSCTNAGWLKINVEGSLRYVNLCSAN